MSILISDFIAVMEELAPVSLAEDWDNPGLQLGSRDDAVESVLVTLNFTDEVLSEAVSLKCGLVLTHHPLIFKPILSASDDTATGRLINRAGKARLAVFAAHTNLDAATGGLADAVAGLLGLTATKPLEPAGTGWSKLVVFVPVDDLDKVRQALFDAGAGVIGDYEHCSFMVAGTGNFFPLREARPTIGEAGRDQEVAEHRVEMVFPSKKADEMVEALLKAHSYEEPAYDVYPLETKRRAAGSGRVGELADEMPLSGFAGMAAELFGLDEAQFSGNPDRQVRRIAVVPGSGAAYIAIAARVADVLLSGDFKYSDAVSAQNLGLALIDIPHHASESVALENWVPRLEAKLTGRGVKVKLSGVETGYWQSVSRKGGKATDAEEGESMYHLHVDGGSRGNPGPAGIGVVLESAAGDIVETVANYIGEATNNVAEYQALIAGVEIALDRDIRRLAIFSDSELIVRQLEGQYKVKNEGLKPYHKRAKSLLSQLDEFDIKSIPRESNAHADELVNRAIDQAVS